MNWKKLDKIRARAKAMAGPWNKDTLALLSEVERLRALVNNLTESRDKRVEEINLLHIQLRPVQKAARALKKDMDEYPELDWDEHVEQIKPIVKAALATIGDD